MLAHNANIWDRLAAIQALLETTLLIFFLPHEHRFEVVEKTE
jgi:hypothetical protein